MQGRGMDYTCLNYIGTISICKRDMECSANLGVAEVTTL